MLTALFFIVGVGLLVVGADRLVVGASAMAKKFGLSSLVIGLTVVALGTSTPELCVSVISTLQGKTEIAVGNVVGSNIGNLLLILGVTACITPLVVTRRIVSFDGPVMVIAAGTVAALGVDGSLSVSDGFILLAGMVLYITYSVLSARAANTDETPTQALSLGWSVLWIVVGLGALVGGSQLVLDSAVTIAKACGLSELVIGLTIVAVGTSLPEISTSIIAARRGETDLSVGNIVGSNILNVFAILGASAVAGPSGLAVPTAALEFDIPVMILVSLACLPLFWTHGKITRLDSLVLLGGYVLYAAFLVVNSSYPNLLDTVKLATRVHITLALVVVVSGVFVTLKRKTAVVSESVSA